MQTTAQKHLETIRELTDDLAHSKNCDGVGCPHMEATPDEHNTEYVAEEINDYPREVLTRSNWASNHHFWCALDYQIILDADTRITGKLKAGEPTTARLEYLSQDKWSRLPLVRADIEALLEFAQVFNFGE